MWTTFSATRNWEGYFLLKDIFKKCENNTVPGWHIIKTLNYVCSIHIIDAPVPSVVGSASIDSSFNLMLNYHNVNINSIGVGKKK